MGYSMGFARTIPGLRWSFEQLSDSSSFPNAAFNKPIRPDREGRGQTSNVVITDDLDHLSGWQNQAGPMAIEKQKPREGTKCHLALSV